MDISGVLDLPYPGMALEDERVTLQAVLRMSQAQLVYFGLSPFLPRSHLPVSYEHLMHSMPSILCTRWTAVHPKEPTAAFTRAMCFPNTQFSALWVRAPIRQHSKYTFLIVQCVKHQMKLCLYVRQDYVSGTTGSGGGCPEAWCLPWCFLWWRRERSAREITSSQNMDKLISEMSGWDSVLRLTSHMGQHRRRWSPLPRICDSPLGVTRHCCYFSL